MGARRLEAHRLYSVDALLRTGAYLRTKPRTVKFRAHTPDVRVEINRYRSRQGQNRDVHTCVFLYNFLRMRCPS